MSQGKPYRRRCPIRPEILRDWELDLPIFRERAKADNADESTRDAIDSMADFLMESIGEIRRLRGRMSSVFSDNAVMRKCLVKNGILPRGIEHRGCPVNDH